MFAGGLLGGIEGDTQARFDEAKQIWETLQSVYSGYPWDVRVMEGMFFIRNLDFPTNWGMARKFKGFGHDAAVMKKDILMSAGEWLERAGLKRGVNEGQEIKWLEGAPEKDQPCQTSSA